MKGWRLLELDGNEEFHQSLSALPANKRFKLAGHFIFIRGGDRASAGPLGALRQEGETRGHPARGRVLEKGKAIRRGVKGGWEVERQTGVRKKE